MALKNQKRDKILSLIFDYPSRGFTVREISEKTGVPSSSAQRYLEEVRKEELITDDNKAIITPYFKFLKSFFIIEKMQKIGLIDYLEEELTPSSVIIFGSARKGEYEKESDIDLFVESTKKKQVNLTKYEKLLGHKVQLFVEENIKDLPPQLLNNVVNGIKLRGYFTIK